MTVNIVRETPPVTPLKGVDVSFSPGEVLEIVASYRLNLPSSSTFQDLLYKFREALKP